MKKISSNCLFALNTGGDTYLSGDNISGKITFNNLTDKNIRDVSITFRGIGEIKWFETKLGRHGSTTHTLCYRSHEVFVNNSKIVHDDGILKAGKYTWTINFLVPEECPTSLESKYGHIRYELIVKIDRYYRYDNIYRKTINIIKPIDLNLNPCYRLPLTAEFIKTLCCWPCKGEKMSIVLTVPFGAYTAGQLVRYTLHIHNQTMSDIKGYSIEILRTITFTAKNPKHRQRININILNSSTSTEVCLSQTDRFIEGEIYIPSTTPTTNINDFIFVEYKLKAVLHLSGFSVNPELLVPIIIGTIPIRESVTDDNDIMPTNSRQQILSKVAMDIVSEVQNLNNDLPTDINPNNFDDDVHSDSSLIDTDND